MNKSEPLLPFCLWEELHMHRTNQRCYGFFIFSCSVFWIMRHNYFSSCLLFPLLPPFIFLILHICPWCGSDERISVDSYHLSFFFPSSPSKIKERFFPLVVSATSPTCLERVLSPEFECAQVLVCSKI